jgi:hypothetical protein
MADVFDDCNDQQSKVDNVGQHVVDEQRIVRHGEKMHGQRAPAAAAALPVSSNRFLASATTSIEWVPAE